MLKIRRALISVWDKKDLEELTRKLVEFNVEIISTGKTASFLRKYGILVKDVTSITSFPEILSGRVKTLHPKIFGGILANKRHPLHIDEIRNLSIEPIDMVVVNFYPFEDKLQENLTFEQMLEYIDIGGPALLRAAAKNFKNVACVSSPKQYKEIIEELEKNKGFISEEMLRKLAEEVFNLTKKYDACIYSYFKNKELLTLDLEKVSTLRYGENPHQKAKLYKQVNLEHLKFRHLQGKELSFNNLLDLDSALLVVREFGESAAAIIKHGSICGVGIDKKLSKAYKKAYSVDPVSSFGGIIGLNGKVDADTAREILKSDFKECVAAPLFSKEALKILSSKKNLILLEVDMSSILLDTPEIRTTVFGYLVQEKDTISYDKDILKVVTKAKPTQKQIQDLIFAWKIVKYVKSNAIVVAKNKIVLGIGGGQPSRIGAVKIAFKRAANLAKGAVLASDGFFPKEDSIKYANKKGICAIIQPGGSIKDKDIIELCNKLGICMVFTGIRHFRH
ncbi:MAG: bifunctional phosphoribosylaminoimidazolecarboxamide formyltransferase/IMP cyclohydrolase [Candidatus Omnitrophica bacterium]|nr:bifunctional phosphoribosylaminoimidazolecarboxamide formyltransferase/IMP cyclohydrolase [Candidatus Omnitrophota bacterium]